MSGKRVTGLPNKVKKRDRKKGKIGMGNFVSPCGEGLAWQKNRGSDQERKRGLRGKAKR